VKDDGDTTHGFATDEEIPPTPPGKRRKGRRPPLRAVKPGEIDWRAGLLTTEKGEPRANVANAILALRNTWPDVFAFDDFTQGIRVVGAPPWDPCDAPEGYEPGELADTDVTRVVAWLARHEGVDVSTDTMWKAIAVVAESKRVHPVREFLAGLRWDGVPRVERWLSTYLGAESTPYTRKVGPIVLRSAVARVMRPGCKVDTMAVLEGPQGTFKSSAIKALFGAEWTSDSPLDFGTKDRFVQLRGKWGVEIPELDGFDRADVNRIKSFLSSPVDDFRPPYGRASVRAPRQCILIGTVNPGATGYLRDVTGGRRFLPFKVGDIALDALVRDREQLWAEAAADFRAGRPWWPDASDAETFGAEQEARFVVDSWEDKIRSYLDEAAAHAPRKVQGDGKAWTRTTHDGRPFVTVADLLERALGMVEAEKHSQAAQNRVAAVLHRLGWERGRPRLRPLDGAAGDGIPTRGYQGPAPRAVPGDPGVRC
jgi:predicted P-loop ATPase